MLFKTADKIHGNGFVYLDLPKVFHYEILQDNARFSEHECRILDIEVIATSDEIHHKSGCITHNIVGGAKNIYFDVDGLLKCHFFLGSGWIINENGKTIERL